MTNDLTLILSLVSLGFFGGFSHCVGMCGPFVLTQVANRLEKIPLEEFSNFSRLKNAALFPYHLGRITTYSLIGFFCSFFTQNIEGFFSFKIFSAVFLIGAALFFLNMFFEKSPNLTEKIKLPFKSKTLKNSALFFGYPKTFLAEKFSPAMSALFKNPQGSKGYILGLVLGFIPCGLLYGAFMIAAAISNPFWAACGMFLFGLSTFPALFLTAFGGSVFLKFQEFKPVMKAVVLINAIMLVLMAIKLIK